MKLDSADLGLLLLGLILGMRHATDPDHVIAVTAILTREKKVGRAARIGLAWGLGHSATVIAVGLAIIVFRVKIPLRLGLAMEFVVALALILLGLRAAQETISSLARKLGLSAPGASTLVVHAHPHLHEHSDLAPHTHLHVHPAAAATGPAHGAAHDHLGARELPLLSPGRSGLKSFLVGLAHGLAGSAAIALLVMAAIPQPAWAMLYLALFCVGVVLGMILITTAIGAPFAFAAGRLAGLHRRLALGAGWLSFGFGAFLAYQTTMVDGLFSAAALWILH